MQGSLATLSTVLQTIAASPGILQDPNAKLVFNKIISLTGTISPLEIQATQAQPMPGLIQSGPMPQIQPANS